MKTLTSKQVEQFNRMRSALLLISNGYQTTKQLRKDSESHYGLDFEEAIEMAYENIQTAAKQGCKGIKAIEP